MKEKKFLIILTFLLIIVISIKLIFGTIDIYCSIPFKNPTFIMSINDQKVSIDIGTGKKIPIIPYVVNLTPYSILFTVGQEKLNLNFGDKIIININGYKCYSDRTGKEKLRPCSQDSSNKRLEEIKDIEYTMKITGGDPRGLSNKFVYEGEFQKDITHLLENKGFYQIVLIAKYGNYESEIISIIKLV